MSWEFVVELILMGIPMEKPYGITLVLTPRGYGAPNNYAHISTYNQNFTPNYKSLATHSRALIIVG